MRRSKNWVVTFPKAISKWTISDSQHKRMEQAKTELTAANRLFKNAKFEDAVKAYGNLIKSKYMQDGQEGATDDGSRSGLSEKGDT